MTRKAAASSPALDDEDLPEWADDQLDRAELAVGGTVVRPANGTLTRVDRPLLAAAAKRQVTLRLDADVLAKFREGGPCGRGVSMPRLWRRLETNPKTYHQ